MMDFQQKGVYMPLLVSRREFLAGMGAMGAATVVVSPSCYALAESASSFRVSIINDEISQDFGHACEVASREFGMRWIELRPIPRTAMMTKAGKAHGLTSLVSTTSTKLSAAETFISRRN